MSSYFITAVYKCLQANRQRHIKHIFQIKRPFKERERGRERERERERERFLFLFEWWRGEYFDSFSPKNMKLNVWSCCVFLFLQWGNCWECTLESARVLNGLNIGKLKKEMQIINISDDACKLWQFLCQPNRAVCSSFIVQTRCGDMKSFAHFERERQRARGELMLFVKLRHTESFLIILWVI